MPNEAGHLSNEQFSGCDDLGLEQSSGRPRSYLAVQGALLAANRRNRAQVGQPLCQLTSELTGFPKQQDVQGNRLFEMGSACLDRTGTRPYSPPRRLMQLTNKGGLAE